MITEAARKARKVPEEEAKRAQDVIGAAARTATEAANSAEEVGELLRTVIMYVGNVLDNESDERFRSIRAANPGFTKRVASRKGGAELMEACGFKREDRGGDVFYVAKQGAVTPAARYYLADFLADHSTKTGGYDAVTALVDPRTIHPEHILDRNQEAGNRIVRILNVRTNHYQVHLPRKP